MGDVLSPPPALRCRTIELTDPTKRSRAHNTNRKIYEHTRRFKHTQRIRSTRDSDATNRSGARERGEFDSMRWLAVVTVDLRRTESGGLVVAQVEGTRGRSVEHARSVARRARPELLWRRVPACGFGPARCTHGRMLAGVGGGAAARARERVGRTDDGQRKAVRRLHAAAGEPNTKTVNGMETFAAANG